MRVLMKKVAAGFACTLLCIGELSPFAIAQIPPGTTGTTTSAASMNPASPSQVLADRKAEAEAKKAEAEAHYYEVKTTNEEWPGTLKGQAASLFLAVAATVTAMIALVNWLLARRTAKEKANLDWETLHRQTALDSETLRDGQYIEGIKMLSDTDRPGARACAAGLIAHLAIHVDGIPNDLVKAQLERARFFENDAKGHPQVCSAIDEALYYLDHKKLPTKRELMEWVSMRQA